MTATEELRALLDARGVEYTTDDGRFAKVTRWEASNGKLAIFAEYDSGETRFALNDMSLTPAQAVEATLGRGECKMEYGGDVTEDTARVMGVYFCSECGSPNYNDCMPYHCIYCGKAVGR